MGYTETSTLLVFLSSIWKQSCVGPWSFLRCDTDIRVDEREERNRRFVLVVSGTVTQRLLIRPWKWKGTNTIIKRWWWTMPCAKKSTAGCIFTVSLPQVLDQHSFHCLYCIVSAPQENCCQGLIQEFFFLKENGKKKRKICCSLQMRWTQLWVRKGWECTIYNVIFFFHCL